MKFTMPRTYTKYRLTKELVTRQDSIIRFPLQLLNSQFGLNLPKGNYNWTDRWTIMNEFMKKSPGPYEIKIPAGSVCTVCNISLHHHSMWLKFQKNYGNPWKMSFGIPKEEFEQVEFELV